MRLLVNCPSGESRLLQVDAEATVLELKQVLQEAEGELRLVPSCPPCERRAVACARLDG